MSNRERLCAIAVVVLLGFLWLVYGLDVKNENVREELHPTWEVVESPTGQKVWLQYHPRKNTLAAVWRDNSGDGVVDERMTIFGVNVWFDWDNDGDGEMDTSLDSSGDVLGKGRMDRVTAADLDQRARASPRRWATGKSTGKSN